MSRLHLALRAARELGPGPVLRYVWYRSRLWGGRIKSQTPVVRWEDRPLSFWVQPGIPTDPQSYVGYRRREGRSILEGNRETRRALDGLLHKDRRTVLAEAGEVLVGELRLFGGEPVSVGFPPDWAALYDLTPASAESAPHWSDWSLDRPADIRWAWEPGRFGLVYPLARAFRLTGDHRYSDAFWSALESWTGTWPIHAGPDWTSAQEVALRLIGLVFALEAFGPALAAEPTRYTAVASVIAAHADRIPPTLAYAWSQRNNHLLSEAAGLYTVGALFPEFRRAAGWKRTGREAFLAGIEDQVFADGGYIQHSARYARLALELGLWVARVADACAEPLPAETVGRLGKLAVFLNSLTDADTGGGSMLGHNDGSTLWRLASLDPQDMRPSLQAAGRRFLGRAFYPAGRWDEAALWLGIGAGKAKAARPEIVGEVSFAEAGVHLVRSGSLRACLRAARFRSRPAHSDQLQVEVWAGGKPLVIDPGTFHYQGSPPLDDEFRMAAAHNGPVLDGLEPMTPAGKFLWLDWSRAWPVQSTSAAGGRVRLISARHDGYRNQGVDLRRTLVLLGGREWAVIDEAHGQGERSLRTAWLLPVTAGRLGQGSYRGTAGARALFVRPSEGSILGVYRGGSRIAGRGVSRPSPAWGWRAPVYGQIVPATTIVCEVRGRLPLRLVTYFALGTAGGASVILGENSLEANPVQAAAIAGRKLNLSGRVAAAD